MMLSFMALMLQPDSIRVALIGDSITVGVGASNSSANYPAQLQALLGPGYDVRTFARSGATALKKGSLPIVNQLEFRSIYAFEPNEVVVLLGSNDAASRNWERLRNEFASDLTSILEPLTKLRTHPKVLVCTPPAVFGSHLSDRGKYLDSEVIPIVRQVARETAADIIDVRGAFDGKPELFADGLHPNDAGYALLATTVFDSVFDSRSMKRTWKLVEASSEQVDDGPARNAIDGDPNTYWHTRYDPTIARPPHFIIVDTGKWQWISGFRYLPRQDGGTNGIARVMEVQTSMNGSDWVTQNAKLTHGNATDPTRLAFSNPVNMRYFKFVIRSAVGGPYGSVAELDIIPARPSQASHELTRISRRTK